MQIDFSAHAARWAPSSPVDTATVDLASSGTGSTGADLVICADGSATTRSGEPADSHLSPGVLELTVPFHDGTVRTVFVMTSPRGSDTDATAPDVLVKDITRLREADSDALIVVLHSFPRRHRSPESDAPTPTSTPFERRAISAGANMLISTHSARAPHVDVVQGSLVFGGCTASPRADDASDAEGGPHSITLVLSAEGSSVSTSHAASPAAAERHYTDMLRTTVNADALLRGVSLTDRGGFHTDLDLRHRVPIHVARTGTGTTVTLWEDEPAELRFDRGVPARMYMWERELRRRGATVETIGTRVLFGEGPDRRKYLVHITDTNRTGVPGSMASGNKEMSRDLLRNAGIRIAEGEYFSAKTPVEDALHMLEKYPGLVIKPVDGHAGRGVTVGVTTPDEFRAAWKTAADSTRSGILVEEQFVGEDVRITVVGGVARAANQRVPPRIVGDGVRTVRDLVNANNDLRYDNIHLHSKLIAMTPHRLDRLERAGLTPFSVLPDGDTYVIDHKANLATGGEPLDMTDTIHPSYLRIAERAASAFPGMGIAGIDLLVSDPQQPAEEDSYIAVEVNSLPDLASHGTAFGGTPRNVISDAADLVLASSEPDGNIRRQREPHPVESPTSARLLAAELSARGFETEWLAGRLFLATGHGLTQGFRGATTDRTSQAARLVLMRPLLRRRILDSASLPLSDARTFGSRERDRAWRYAAELGSATLQFGGSTTVDMQGMDRKTFDDAWARNISVIRTHRALISSRHPGERFHLLVVHGRVLGVLRIDGSGSGSSAAKLHRSYRRLAADASRAFAGADIVRVSLIITDPKRPATASSAVIEDVGVNPDLVAFAQAQGASDNLIQHLVDLHLGASRPAPEPEGVWSEDADRARTRVLSAAGSARQRLARRFRRLGATVSPPASTHAVERDGLVFDVGDSSARVTGRTAEVEDLSIPSQVGGKPVTAIAAGSLRGSAALRSVVFPASVTTLDADAFADSPNLERVELPPSLRTISARAFEACPSLQAVVLPTDLQRIAQRAFADCTSLSTLTYFIATGPKDDRVIRRKLIECSIPQSTEYIGVGAFENCSDLSHIAIPHKVTRIRTSTFAGCTGLQSIWLHSAVRQIDAEAFAGCRSLESIHVPSDLTSLAADAFDASTAVDCAEGSAAHGRAVELGLSVAPYPPTAAPIASALGAGGPGDTRTVRVALDDPTTVDELKKVYELRPAMAERTRRPEDRHVDVQPSRFHRAGATYESTSSRGGSDVTLTMVGDLMCGALQQRSARKNGTYDFSESLRHVRSIFGGTDLALGNLETMVAPSFPLAGDRLYVDGRPHLNAPFSYLAMVRNAGIDAVLSAQNHMYDTGTRGILETLDALNDAQLIHGGMYASPDEPRHLLFSIKGITIGVVAYLDPARQKMKKSSFTQEGIDAVTSLFTTDRVRRDIADARAAGAEFVLAYCHWGAEYTEKVTPRQARFAQMVADAGADYIYGSHSHCPQPYTVLTAQSGQQVPIVYSGGNFVAYIDRHKPITLDTFISSLTLTRDDSGAVVMKDDGYLPCRIVADRGTRGLVSVVALDELEDGALGYDPITARADRARIAAVLGPDYRSLPRSAFR